MRPFTERFGVEGCMQGAALNYSGTTQDCAAKRERG